MAREKVSTCLNMDEPENKRRLMSKIGTLAGWWEVELSPRRNTRSLQQNKWYHACICKTLADHLSEQDYNVTTPGDVHELLKARFLAGTLVNEHGEPMCDESGRPIRYIRSTASLTTAEFSDYCERCRAWLADFFNLVVPDPDPAWVSQEVAHV